MFQVAVGLYKMFRNKTISRGGPCTFLQVAHAQHADFLLTSNA